MTHLRAQPQHAGERPTLVRYAVLFGLCLAAIVAYVQRNSIAVAESTIRRDLFLDKEQMGLVLSAFFVTYAIFQIPSGWLSDRWGARRTLRLYVVLSSAAVLLFALAGILFLNPSTRALFPTSTARHAALVVGWLLAARLLAGAAQAGLFPCAAMIFSRWLPPTRRAMASGVLSAAMQTGGVLGMLLTGFLLERAGWDWLFAWFALPGILWAMVFFRWFRDRPAEHPAVNVAELELLGAHGVDHQGEPPREATPWLLLVTSPPMWCICGQQFFRAGGYIFYATWFATFLQEDREATIAQSGVLGSVPLVAGILGGPLGGGFSDWVLERTGSHRLAKQGVGAVSCAASAAFIIFAYGIANTTATVLLIGLGAFCASLAGGITYSTTIDMSGPNIAAEFGAMNMWGNIGAFLFPSVVPYVLAAAGKNWGPVIYLFGGVHFCAALCWLALDPRGKFAEHSLLRRRQ